jgi:hypothetical protein
MLELRIAHRARNGDQTAVKWLAWRRQLIAAWTAIVAAGLNRLPGDEDGQDEAGAPDGRLEAG